MPVLHCPSRQIRLLYAKAASIFAGIEAAVGRHGDAEFVDGDEKRLTDFRFAIRFLNGGGEGFRIPCKLFFELFDSFDFWRIDVENAFAGLVNEDGMAARISVCSAAGMS